MAEKRAEKPKRGTFIVWSPDGATPPKVSYSTHGAAHFAAQKMAKKLPGQTFMVMERSGALICNMEGAEEVA